MQVQVDIGFAQLLKIVKALPSEKLKQLRAEIDKEIQREQTVDLETLLLNGPTATKKQLDTIANVKFYPGFSTGLTESYSPPERQALNRWR